MSLPSFLDGMSEVRGALTADSEGQLSASRGPDMDAPRAAATAFAANGIAAAGDTLGLARLELMLVKGPSTATVTAIRAGELLHVAVDPAKATGPVEKALQAWSAGEEATPPALTFSVPRPAAPRRAAPTPVPPTPSPPASSRAASASPAPPVDDPWGAMRRALVRGQLTEAATRRRELATAAVAPPRPGAEPMPEAELDAAMQALLQGIGSVLAGDGVGGARTLEALAAQTQRNLSLRWLALYWSGRAALKSGSSAVARTHLTEALLVAKQLDGDAMATSQWIAAEVLSHDGDHRRALACLTAARSGFEKLRDRWGLGQTWLAEARVLAALQRGDDATAAARQAWATDPMWEEPAVFLARRALLAGDLAEAEGLLRYIAGPLAERVRAVIDAIRQDAVSQPDAAEYLRESDAPPTARAIKAMERIAQAAPRFVQAREALAWMLLKVGKYDDAGTIFRGLLGQQLSQPERASVMLGLGCIAHAQQSGKDPDAKLQAAVMAGVPPAANGAGEAMPLPALSSSASLPARSSQLPASAVFSGQLSVFAFPDVLEFVRSARRTGMLVLSAQGGMAAVQFRDGRITGATSPGTPDLGDLLLESRKISSVTLRALREAQPAGQPDHVLGGVLVKEGAVDEVAVRDALRRKIELTVAQVLKWKDGEFAFNRDGDADPASADPAVEFDAQDVLLNVMKRLDEDSRDRAAPAAP
jgi:hypothetical protein